MQNNGENIRFYKPETISLFKSFGTVTTLQTKLGLSDGWTAWVVVVLGP